MPVVRQMIWRIGHAAIEDRRGHRRQYVATIAMQNIDHAGIFPGRARAPCAPLLPTPPDRYRIVPGARALAWRYATSTGRRVCAVSGCPISLPSRTDPAPPTRGRTIPTGIPGAWQWSAHVGGFPGASHVSARRSEPSAASPAARVASIRWSPPSHRALRRAARTPPCSRFVRLASRDARAFPSFDMTPSFRRGRSDFS